MPSTTSKRKAKGATRKTAQLSTERRISFRKDLAILLEYGGDRERIIREMAAEDHYEARSLLEIVDNLRKPAKKELAKYLRTLQLQNALTPIQTGDFRDKVRRIVQNDENLEVELIKKYHDDVYARLIIHEADFHRKQIAADKILKGDSAVLEKTAADALKGQTRATEILQLAYQGLHQAGNDLHGFLPNKPSLENMIGFLKVRAKPVPPVLQLPEATAKEKGTDTETLVRRLLRGDRTLQSDLESRWANEKDEKARSIIKEFNTRKKKFMMDRILKGDSVLLDQIVRKSAEGDPHAISIIDDAYQTLDARFVLPDNVTTEQKAQAIESAAPYVIL